MDENISRGYCQLPCSNNRRAIRPPASMDRLDPPRDPCNCIYIALILAGVGFLLPYNSFITAVDYYQARFPGTTIIFDMSLTYIVVAFASVCINNVLVEALPLSFRITFGYLLAFCMLLFVALCDVWFELFSASGSYKITIAAIAAVGVGSTVQQSSFYGYTSMLPRRYTQAVMTGESAAGLLVSLNRVLTKALLNDQKINTIIFFSISIGILWLCCITFHLTRRTDFVKFYVNMCESAAASDDQRGITTNTACTEEVDFMEQQPRRDTYGVLIIQSPTCPSSPVVHEPVNGAPDDNSESDKSPDGRYETTEDHTVHNTRTRKYLPFFLTVRRGLLMRYEVSKTIWPYMLSIGLAYFVTLCLFPGIESEIFSCGLKSWMPIIVMGVFNLFDFIGKVIASVPYDWPSGRLVVGAMCRILLVPLMMLCATPRSYPVLAGEGWPVILSIVLGISNGYFGSVPMILAPGKVNDEQKELTGNIMTMSYSLGLTAGSVTAYLLDEWLGPALPYDPCAWNMTLIEGTNNTAAYYQ